MHRIDGRILKGESKEMLVPIWKELINAYEEQKYMSRLVNELCTLAEQAYCKELGGKGLLLHWDQDRDERQQLFIERIERLSEGEVEYIFGKHWLWHRRMKGSYLGVRSQYEIHKEIKGSWITSGLSIAILISSQRFHRSNAPNLMFEKVKPHIGDEQVRAVWPAWGSAYWSHDEDFTMLMLALIVCKEEETEVLMWLLDHPCASLSQKQWDWIIRSIPVKKFSMKVHQKVRALIDKERIAAEIQLDKRERVQAEKRESKRL